MWLKDRAVNIRPLLVPTQPTNQPVQTADHHHGGKTPNCLPAVVLRYAHSVTGLDEHLHYSHLFFIILSEALDSACFYILAALNFTICVWGGNQMGPSALDFQMNVSIACITTAYSSPQHLSKEPF